MVKDQPQLAEPIISLMLPQLGHHLLSHHPVLIQPPLLSPFPQVLPREVHHLGLLLDRLRGRVLLSLALDDLIDEVYLLRTWLLAVLLFSGAFIGNLAPEISKNERQFFKWFLAEINVTTINVFVDDGLSSLGNLFE